MRNYPIGKLAGLETREKASLAGRDTRANDTTLLAGAHDTSVAGWVRREYNPAPAMQQQKQLVAVCQMPTALRSGTNQLARCHCIEEEEEDRSFWQVYVRNQKSGLLLKYRNARLYGAERNSSVYKYKGVCRPKRGAIPSTKAGEEVDENKKKVGKIGTRNSVERRRDLAHADAI